jgi:threonine dehydrogenase-like Zn-dependent dehydrogenase
MRTLVLTGPRQAEIRDVPTPIPETGEVLIDVARVGVCGTDVEFFTGTMPYLVDGRSRYPLRPGHEWCGTVTAVGDWTDPQWVGRRVTGDTMLGCRRCRRCRAGLQHVCAFRTEIGVRNDRPGALAEQLAVPVSALHPLPDGIDDTVGALVEPGGNALRAVQAANLRPGDRLLILGPGTIGLLVAGFARAGGVEVHLIGLPGPSLAFASSLGFTNVWTAEQLPELPFDAIVDASNAPSLPALALDRVEPGKRVVYIGLSGSPSLVDTRTIVLKDLTVVGVLGASQGLTGAIERYATRDVDPTPLVAATVGLEQTAEVLAGWRPANAGPGPKIHVDPRR